MSEESGEHGAATESEPIWFRQLSEEELGLIASGMDFYGVLGLAPYAEEEEIRAAYRRLAKKYHPDSGGPDADPGRMAALNRARYVLTTPAVKHAYDELLAASRQVRTARAGFRTGTGTIRATRTSGLLIAIGTIPTALVLVLIAWLVLYGAGSGDDGSDRNPDWSSAAVPDRADTSAVPLANKLLGVGGVSQSDRSAIREIYRSTGAFTQTISSLVYAYSDPTVSTEEFLARVAAAKGDLSSHLNTIGESVAGLGDAEIRGHFISLRNAVAKEIRGLNTVAAGLRDGGKADVEAGRRTFNTGAREATKFDQALRGATPFDWQ